MDTLCTFRGSNIAHYKAESVHFGGPMNSATKKGFVRGSLKGSSGDPFRV